MLYRKNISEWQEENRTKITQTGVHALTMFLISVQEWQNQNNQTGVHALTMFLISVQECYMLCFLIHLQRLIWHSTYRKKSISNILPEIGTFCFFTLNKWKPSYAAEMTTRMQYRFTAQYFTRNGNCLICSPENS